MIQKEDKLIKFEDIIYKNKLFLFREKLIDFFHDREILNFQYFFVPHKLPSILYIHYIT